MNIFDGFEEANPEETAAKLGIKTNNLVNDTTNELFDVENNTRVLNVREYENHSKWAYVNNVRKLRPGMRIRTFDWKTFGPAIIINVDTTNEMFTILEENGFESEEYHFSDLKDKFEVYIDDKGVTTTTDKLGDIKNLKEGLIVERWDGELLAVKNINPDGMGNKEDYFIVTSDDMGSGESVDEITNYDIVSFVYPSNKEKEQCLAYTQLDPQVKKIDSLWRQIEMREELVIGARIKKGEKLGKITKAPKENDFHKLFTVQFEDGSTKTYDFEKFNLFEILLIDYKSHERYALERNGMLDEEELWSKTERPKDGISRNTRLKNRRGKKKEYTVIDIRNGKYQVDEIYGATSQEYTYEEIQKNFEVYIVDLNHQNPIKEVIFNEGDLEIKTRWRDVIYLETVKPGNILRFQSPTSASYLKAEIISIDGNEILTLIDDAIVKSLDFEEFSKKYQIFIPSIMNNLMEDRGIPLDELLYEDYWTGDYDRTALKVGMRIKQPDQRILGEKDDEEPFFETRKYMKILEISNGKLKAIRGDGHIIEKEVEGFPFLVFKADMEMDKKATNMLKDEERESDILWTRKFTIEQLKIGDRVQKYVATKLKKEKPDLIKDININLATKGTMIYGIYEDKIRIMNMDNRKTKDYSHEKFMEMFQLRLGK